MFTPQQMIEKNILDELIRKHVGAFGFWQQSTILLATTLGLCYVLIPTLLNSVPQHFCRPTMERQEEWDNISERMNLSYPSMEYWQKFIQWYIPPLQNTNETGGDQKYSACQHYVDPVAGNFTTQSCENGWIYLSEYSLYRKTLTEEFDLVCDRGWLSSLDSTVYTSGMFTGYLIVGPLSDAYGRRITYITMTSLLVIANFVISLSNSYTLYMILRFLIALCCNAAYSSIYILIGETSVNEYRPWITSFSFLAYSFTDRAIFLTLAYFIQNWRWFYVSLAAVTSGCAIFIYYLPESPRWSLTHGKPEDVVKALNFIGSWNQWFRRIINLLRRTLMRESVIFEEDYIPLTVKDLSGDVENLLLSSIQRHACLSRDNLILRTRDELLLSVRRPVMIKRFFGQALLWIFMGMSYYGLLFSSDSLFETPYVGLIAVSFFALPAYLTQASVSNRFGRRNTILVSMLATDILLVMLILVLTFSPQSNVHLTATTLTAVIFCLTELICGVCTTYAMELFPTSLRNIGTAYLNAILCTAGGVSVFVNKLDKVSGKSYAPTSIFLVTAIIGTGGILVLPETMNTPLPENVRDI